MFHIKTVLSFALVLSTVVLVGWYVRRRNRKIRQNILSRNDIINNNEVDRFDDQVTKKNLSIILKGNRFVLFFVNGFILFGYLLRMLPIGFTCQLLIFTLLAYTLHIVMSRCYAINIIWCHGIISINADIDIKLFPKLRILKIFHLSGETTR